jgi:catechol 2,3-dioxygenase
MAALGAGGPELVVLTEKKGARRVRRASGLYHFAILVPSRLELAQVLKRIGETRTPVEGFSDHLVSEAIYLPDPDGNGIEMNRDRPRSEWPYDNGRLRMATDPLDIDGVLGELKGQTEPWQGLARDTVLGHMHLHVANVADAEAFYHGVLGFDVIFRMRASAGFVSAGGYHHHIAFNTWAGAGVPPPPPDSVGLRWFEIRLPNSDELAKVIERIRAANIAIEERADGLLVRDPSQNGVLLKGD